MAIHLGRAGDQPIHPEARSIRLNAILREELVPVESPLGRDGEVTRKAEEMWRERLEEKAINRENECPTRTFSTFSLVLGKKPRFPPTSSTKRVPNSSQYSFLELNPPLPPLPDLIPPPNPLPKYPNPSERPVKSPEKQCTGLIRGTVYCLASVSGSDVYVVDVVEASSDLICLFQKANKDRFTLIHRSRGRVGAGSGVLVVSPVCIDATALFFVAEKVLPAV